MAAALDGKVAIVTGAGVEQTERHGAAEAAAGAGHDGNFSVKSCGHNSPLSGVVAVKDDVIIRRYRGRRSPQRPVARVGRPAYIPAAFQSSLMTLSGFARAGGRSTEKIYRR